jgi:hypothetical protein
MQLPSIIILFRNFLVFGGLLKRALRCRVDDGRLVACFGGPHPKLCNLPHHEAKTRPPAESKACGPGLFVLFSMFILGGGCGGCADVLVFRFFLLAAFFSMVLE